MTSSPLLKYWRSIGLLVLVLIIVGYFTLGGKSSGYGNGQWSTRHKVTLDPTAVGIPDATGTTPVLVRLHDGNYSFGGAKEDGSDIRFVANDQKTELPYQIERYDSLLGEAFVWVRVPEMKAGAPVTFWLYYGNDKASTPKNKDPFDSDTVLVYHFDENGQPPADATGSGNTGDKAGVTSPGSFIGGGLRLNGQSIVSIPASPSLQTVAAGTMTWSAWIKPSALQPNAVIFSRRDGAGDFVVGLDNGVPYADIGGARSGAGTPVAVNTWHHLAVTVSGTQATLYVDGEVYNSWAATLPAMNTAATIGGDSVGGANFTGEIDELEISKIARPAALIKLAAQEEGGGNADKALIITTAETTSGDGGSSNLYYEILKNVTIDGWIVIAVLVTLGVLTVRVAWGKWNYLKKNREANAAFMKAWRQVSSDLTVLDHSDSEKVKTLGGRLQPADLEDFRDSSVYRVYHIGAEEVRHRLMGFRNGDSHVLSAQSIQAIRASLDTGFVAETEKFNEGLNTLTNSIAGGPFIGLAGTVAGVTITFASIAQAGEVNVNAIAPGISAALVATLAGLFLAIPTTFVYNALTARIEASVNELQVFIDEYVTKLAEFYRPSPNTRRNGGASDIDHLLDGLSELISASRANTH